MPDGLFVNEQQMAARLGFTLNQWALFRPDYTRQGLPAADPISGMRYWPAVKAFFDNIAGIGTAVRLGFVANGEERPDALRRGYRKNAR